MSGHERRNMNRSWLAYLNMAGAVNQELILLIFTEVNKNSGMGGNRKTILL